MKRVNPPRPLFYRKKMDYRLLIFIGVLAVAALFLMEKGCTTVAVKNSIDTVYVPTFYPSEIVHDTVEKSRIRYTPVFFRDTVILGSDTIITTKQPFTAESDTTIFKSGDTLQAKYSFPENIFTYKFHAKTDTSRIITKTETITIQPSKFSYGLQTGVGYLQSFRTGQNAIGWYLGVGVQWKF